MRVCATAVYLMVLLGACSRYSTVEMLGSRTMFLGGVITPSPGSGEFLAIIELTPAEHRDGEKMCKLLRAGHPVSLRLREEPDQPPILVTDVTAHGEAIIRCKTEDEAKHVIDRLHAWPLHKSDLTNRSSGNNILSATTPSESSSLFLRLSLPGVARLKGC
jgi:hypothetical protein